MGLSSVLSWIATEFGFGCWLGWKLSEGLTGSKIQDDSLHSRSLMLKAKTSAGVIWRAHDSLPR